MCKITLLTFVTPRSKIALLKKINDAGFVKLSAQLATDHYERCAKNSSFLEMASAYYRQLGAYDKALEIRDRLVAIDPASAGNRFWRGKIFEGMGRFDKALSDYISALDLLGRPEQVEANSFYEIATMYAALGKYCEAATPLETYIAFNYAQRNTPQLGRVIDEYRSKGNCKKPTRSENAVIRAKRPGSVLLIQASLNNVSGVFVLDTGASMVSVTKSFAMKSRIAIDSESEVTLQTANGLAKGILSTAKSVQVGSVSSTFVPVVVMEDKQLGTDDDVVGLLGMSFLSRFDVTVTKDSVELRSR